MVSTALHFAFRSYASYVQIIECIDHCVAGLHALALDLDVQPSSKSLYNMSLRVDTTYQFERQGHIYKHDILCSDIT